MDITLLVKVLAPALPFLLGLGQKAIDKGAEKLGEKGAEGLVGKMWQMLKPKVEAKPAAIEAAADVANAPEDEDAIASLRQQLKKILEAPENADLAAEITKLLAESDQVTGGKYNVQVKDSNVGVIGERNIVTQHIGTKP
jgi:hypothetical protein